MRLDRDVRGMIHLGTVDIPSDELVAFTQALRDRCEAHSDFEDVYFGHEIRGLKEAHTHHPSDPDARAGALADFTSCLDMGRINDDEWWVDVALEIHSRTPGIVQWLDTAPPHILREVLPLATDGQIERLRGGKRFYTDTVAQIGDFAGFRVEPGAAGTQDGVRYINVYTTDKAVTYQLHHGLWRRRTAQDTLPDNIPRLTEDIERMKETYQSCIGPNPQVGTARLEIRVRMCDASDVLLGLPHRILRECVAVVPPNVWWMFKLYRLSGLFLVLKAFQDKNSDPVRSIPEALTLGAIIIYMLNALNYRPQASKDEVEL
ncbi:hypothetical protein FA95DRAFT_1506929, partial [Auriscalpium vulgare]